MDNSFYQQLAQDALNNQDIDQARCIQILEGNNIELLPLLQAAYEVRRHYFGKEVRVHILNNAQNGHCPEDCHYCAQAKSSKADIEEYGIKSDAEMLAEARDAYAKGASCYCMVFAGRAASQSRLDRLKRVIGQIKAEFPDKEICVSTGFVNPDGAKQLKQSGLDRLNHNLNTSAGHYGHICTTHTYEDRLNTVLAAKSAGLKVCSGMIVGMGEQHHDIIDVARELRRVKAESIPINLLIPIEGNQLKENPLLTPDFCLRILCLFRFLNPQAEIRVAAGREIHLRSMQVMALYPANSLFLQGYLNAQGESNGEVLQMIQDAGFTIKSDMDIQQLMQGVKKSPVLDGQGKVLLKDLKQLRPVMSS